MNELMPYDPLSAIVAGGVFANACTFLIQKMKESHWSIFDWVTKDNPWSVKLLGVVAAALGSSGLDVMYADDPATHTGTMVITGITAAAIIKFGYLMAQQLTIQHYAHKLGFPDKSEGGIQVEQAGSQPDPQDTKK